MYKMVCVDATVILELSHNIKMKYDDREFSYNLLHYMISLFSSYLLNLIF